MSPFCSIDTGGNQLIGIVVVVAPYECRDCGAPLGTKERHMVDLQYSSNPFFNFWDFKIVPETRFQQL